MIDFGIIAAGDGNRIKEEGSLLPKPLVEIDGAPMIGRLIDIMLKAGAASISVIVNSDMPEVITFLNNLKDSVMVPLRILDRKTESSMHTFHELMQLMQPQDKFVVTTVDTIFKEKDFIAYIDTFKNSSPDIDGLMGLTDFIDDEKPLYVDVNSQGFIKAYLDETAEGIKYVSAGIYGLNRKAIPVLDKCVKEGVKRMRNFQRSLVGNGLKLKGYNLGKVIDVDHLSDIENANLMLRQG